MSRHKLDLPPSHQSYHLNRALLPKCTIGAKINSTNQPLTRLIGGTVGDGLGVQHGNVRFDPNVSTGCVSQLRACGGQMCNKFLAKLVWRVARLG